MASEAARLFGCHLTIDRDDFTAYANVCFQNFGDRVKHWITINEPQVWALYGYTVNTTNTLENAATDPFLCAHHIILAHATAVKLYRDTYQDQDAARRAFDFLVGWFLKPLVFRDYPFIMKDLVRDGLLEFTDDEKTLIKGSFEFIGISNPSFLFVAFVTAEKDGVPIGAPTPGSTEIYIYPKGLTDALVYISNAYNNPKFLLLRMVRYPEKRDDTIAVETALQDDFRIQHILQHLYAISVAIKYVLECYLLILFRFIIRQSQLNNCHIFS
uniref:Beta-glucosidase n=1 Tax=Quercus lobata TaxID=97700 RepID=A0A7N2KYK2_QUELO